MPAIILKNIINNAINIRSLFEIRPEKIISLNTNTTQIKESNREILKRIGNISKYNNFETIEIQ